MTEAREDCKTLATAWPFEAPFMATCVAYVRPLRPPLTRDQTTSWCGGAAVCPTNLPTSSENTKMRWSSRSSTCLTWARSRPRPAAQEGRDSWHWRVPPHGEHLRPPLDANPEPRLEARNSAEARATS